MSEDKRYKIELITFCYNESPVIPVMTEYWRHLGIDKVTVYDNGSDDGSVKMLESFKGCSIKTYDTAGTLNDTVIADMKNKLWKECDADFCIVCDFDEIPFAGSGDFNDLLSYMEDNGYDICRGIGTECISEAFPEILPGELCHESPSVRYSYSNMMSKALLFRPGNLSEINYTAGAHMCSPIRKDGTSANILDGNKYPGGAFTLHFKKLGYDYLLEKYRKSALRLSEDNIKFRHGLQYNYSDEKLRMEFIYYMKKSKSSLKELYQEMMNENL